jgi:hypothetical protein
MGKTTKPKGIFSPFWLSLAAAAGWGAVHVPASLDIGSAAAWALLSLAAGLVAAAALALAGPLLGLMAALAGRTMAALRQGDEP